MARGKLKRRPKPKEFERRGLKRLIPITGFVVVTFGLAWFFESQATTTIIFVRHTDTQANVSELDPPLSRLGQHRAELLADILEDIDVIASVDAIYASDHRRTQETAVPLAERLELDVRIEDPYVVEPFMAQVLREHKGQIVLVVTLSDAIAPLVEELHGSKNIPEIVEGEYDNIYVVTIPWFGKVKTLRMRYGFFDKPDESVVGPFSGPPAGL